MQAKVIKNEAEYREALKQVEALWDALPGTPEAETAELWTLLIENYEKQHYPIEAPDAVSAILFRMEQQGLTRNDLIPIIGSKGRVSEILNRKRDLSLSMIRKLHSELGIPAEVLLQKRAMPVPALAHVEWQRFPVNEMVKRRWFPNFEGKAKDALEQAEELIGPLVFPDGQDCRTRKLAARQNVRDGSTPDEHAMWAWQGRVLCLAKEKSVGDYDPKAMIPEFIRKVVGLSVLDDGPVQAGRFLAKSGIALVILNYLPGTHLDGAAMVGLSGKPVVAVTLRHDRLDNFWFTLAHELAHVVLHLTKDATACFLDDLESDIPKSQKEKEADRLAADSLIPPREWNRAGGPDMASDVQVRNLASRVHIHPAIVAGRLRFEKDSYHLFSNLVGSRLIRKLFPTYQSGLVVI